LKPKGKAGRPLLQNPQNRSSPPSFSRSFSGDLAKDKGGKRDSDDSWTGVAPARRAAFDVLFQVGHRRDHSDELLHSPRLDALNGQDRNLTMALVMGVLRWQIALDAQLRTFLTRPDQPMADEIWIALRMGAFQLLHMDRIPAHAALSESVAICRAAGQEHAAGMVNAVLRRLTREPVQGAKLYESTAAIAERLAHPAWLVERWVRTYGRPAALAICEAGLQEPRGPGSSGMFASSAGPGGRADTAGFDDPLILEELAGLSSESSPSMDDGSRLVGEIAAVAAPAVSGRAVRAWDCCAAPGGKTMLLARRLIGADLLATDASKRRLQATEQRIGGLATSAGSGGTTRCLVANATALPVEEGMFDLVLCDVPCSGTGTLARNPEIRHRLHPEDLARQAQRQKELLRAAMARVAAGGRLVYSTCSLEPEECEQVVEALEDGWRRVPVADLLRTLQDRRILREGIKLESLLLDKQLRTFPGVHGCDGFYAVVLERRTLPLS